MTTEVKTPERIMSEMQLRQMQLHPMMLDYSDYSPNNILNEAVAIQCYILNALVAQKEADLDPMTAEGAALSARVLDRLPEGRLGGTKATGDVKFSRDTPAPANIAIPEGTLVAMVADSGEVVKFKTTAAAIMLEDTSEVTVAVEADEVGIDGNVPAYTIDRMIGQIGGLQHVVNQLALTGGTDEESDSDLRDRYIAAASATGNATAAMLKSKLEALSEDGASIVREASVFGLGNGDVEIVVDPVDRDNPPDAIWYCIRDTLAVGPTACGVIAASLRPSSSVYGIDDSSGGEIWIRCADVYANSKTLTIAYIDELGNAKDAIVTITGPSLRGKCFKASLEEAGVLACEILGSDYDEDGSFDILIGRGEYPYLYTIPEAVPVQVYMRVRFTETPETDLRDLIEDSLTDKLNSYLSGARLEYSDVSKYAYLDFIEKREFDGIEEILELTLTCKGEILQMNGQRVTLENDERLQAGTVNVEVVEE